MVEAALVLPAMTFLILVMLQLTMLQHARIMTDYAAYCAARAGIVFNADPRAMEQAAKIALAPTIARSDTLLNLTQTATVTTPTREGVLRSVGLPLVVVETLNPRPADFNAENSQHLGGAEIDFDDLRPAAARANLLQIRLIYHYEMKIPFANQMLQAIYFAQNRNLIQFWRGMDMTRPEIGAMSAVQPARQAYMGSGQPYAAQIGAAAFQNRYVFPLQATYSMRMQSNPFLRNVN